MKHKLIPAAAMALLVLAQAPAPAQGGDPQRQFGRVPTTGLSPSLEQLVSRNGSRMVDIAVALEGRPVAVAAGVALRAGTRMTTAQRGDLRRSLQRSQPRVAAGLRKLGARIEARYTDVFNGFRIRVPAASVARIANLPGVTRLYTVQKHTRANANTDAFINADRTWGQTGFTGAGVKIAIINSGINYNHVDFGGAGQAAFDANDGTVVEPGSFPTAKVVSGYDLVGDDYDADEDGSAPHPDPDPLDCKAADAGTVQHGTHVAGTAAGFGVKANGQTYTGAYNASTLSSTTFSIGPGVAPRAKLMAYRVFGCNGSTSVVVDAIERAVHDGADVINMSLGTDLGSPDALDAVASNNAALAGVTVVSSAGNAGPSAYEVGSPAVATRVIAVGAVDAVRGYPGATVDLATQPNVAAINANDAALPVSGLLHRFVDDPATETDPDTGAGGENLGCDAASYAYNQFTTGQIAVVDRGGCARVQKAQVGQPQGAASVVMINTDSALPPFEQAIGGVSIPFIGVSAADAERFDIDNGTVATISGAGVISNPFFKHAAPFSSAGPRRTDLMIKPDVAAPGMSVFSADGSTGSFGKSLSGTSMAAPAVAGVAALVKQAHPGWSPAQIKAAIVSTAGPNQVDPYQVVLSGSGVAAPRRAVDTKGYATTDPGSSSLTFGYHDLSDVPGSTVAYRQTRQLTLHNTSNAVIKYTLTSAFNTASLGLTVAISPTSVNVPANTTRTVDVTLAMTEAAAAALADVAPFHAPAIAADDSGQLFTPMASVAGVVLATPTSEGTGIYPLRIPWLVVPRGDSDVKDVAGTRTAYVKDGDLRHSTVEVRNKGLHAGIMDVYQWGLDDPNDGLAGIDLRSAGVQSLDSAVCDSGAPAKDRCLVFAINTWGRWSNAAEAEFDVIIDRDGDGEADVAVIGVDLGLVVGAFFGVEGSVILDLHTNTILNLYFATAAPNGSTLLLPALASDLGLAKNDDRNFTYSVESFTVYDDVQRTDGMGTKPGRFNAFRPLLSNGDFVPLDPGASTTLVLNVDAARYVPNKGMLGWMVVTLEDANGKAQADTLPVGTVPK